MTVDVADVADAADVVDTMELDVEDDDAEVKVEDGRTLVRDEPYNDLQVSLSMPSGQQSVLLSLPG